MALTEHFLQSLNAPLVVMPSTQTLHWPMSAVKTIPLHWAQRVAPAEGGRASRSNASRGMKKVFIF